VPTTKANDVELCYEFVGDERDPVLVMICGHGTQLISWDDRLVDRFVALGIRVLRFDNRDVGLSTHFDDLATPDPWAIAFGDRSTVPYEIEDLADDTAGMLGSLGLDRVHVLGMSMGGMVAQSLAIRHPDVVASLTSIMSSPDPLRVGTPSDEVIERWLLPAPTTREAAIERAVASWYVEGSPELGVDEPWIADVVGRHFDRARDPAGVARQLGAIVASEDRRPALAGLDVPTLVVHGAVDPVITVQGGEATANAIRGARLVVIDKMGHDLPAAMWPELLESFAKVAGL
jgi:pimeloyl-ACP methyl ester carboxylesterase